MTPESRPIAPRLSLCMIVKNEERYLEGCLQSVQGLVDEIVIVDTGSTDGTLAIADRFGAKSFSFPWNDDFSAARNASLAHATGDWILVLDADERLDEASKEYLKPLLNAKDVAGYSLVCESAVESGVGDQHQRAPVFRLLRNHLDIRFEGMIHEQAIGSAKRTGLKTVASNVKIRHLGYASQAIVSRDKRQRNLAILERQVELEPENAFAHFNLGEVLKLLERFSEAEWHYSQALRLLKASQASPNVSYYANLYFSLGDLYRREGKFAAAHALLDEAIGLYPRFADLYYTKGFTYFDAERYPEALTQFDACSRLGEVTHPFACDPAIPGHKAMRAIADCHIRMGDRAKAKEYLERTLHLHPDPEASLHANLGILLFENGQDVEAMEQFERAIAREPNDLRSWSNLLHLWLQRRDYPTACAAHDRCPDDPSCRAMVALAFALSDLPLPTDRPSDQIMVLAWSEAVEFALLNHRTELVQDVLDRLDVLGEQANFELSLGHVFLRQQLNDLATGAFLRAQQRAPENPQVFRALGDACLASGNPEDARIFYARADRQGC